MADAGFSGADYIARRLPWRVLAPNARLRALVVPQGPLEQEEPAGQAAGGAECEPEPVQARSHRIGWARLLARVFDIDMQHCPNCGAAN